MPLSSDGVQGFALPEVVNPARRICVQIEIPDEPAHIQAFIGVLYDLTLWNSWQHDVAHTGTQAAQVWKPIWQRVSRLLDTCACPPSGESGEIDAMNVLTQVIEVNGKCLFQYRCCVGDPWITLSVVGDPPSGGQPGAGAPQPPAGGGTQNYCLPLQANGVLLLPTVVNTGDVLTMENATGAGQDGAYAAAWRCPDGELYFAGRCNGLKVFLGGDILPAQAHMSLIYNINGAYYPAMNGPVTVPGGVVNGQVTLQVNDSNISDNNGGYTVCVTVKNNQLATWTAVLDFTLSDYGATIGSDVHDHYGQYIPGVGFQSTLYSFVPQGPLNFFFGFAPMATITNVQTFYSRTSGTLPSGFPNEVYGDISAVHQWASTLDLGLGTLSNSAIGSGAVDSIGFFSGIDAAHATGLTVTKMIVQGTGVNPFDGR